MKCGEGAVRQQGCEDGGEVDGKGVDVEWVRLEAGDEGVDEGLGGGVGHWEVVCWVVELAGEAGSG